MTLQPTIPELNYARSYIGPADGSHSDSDAVFAERFDRLYKTLNGQFPDTISQRARALDMAVEEALRAQLAGYNAEPSSAASGNDSYSTGANIQELSKQLKDFRDIKGTRKATVKRLVRRGMSTRR